MIRVFHVSEKRAEMAAGIIRNEKTNKTPAIGTDRVITTPNETKKRKSPRKTVLLES